ncbi:MAG: TonB-dependent receptor [Cyclobacteriaceae bacterium]
MKHLITCLAILIGFQTFSQEQYTLSGYVKDASNGETLIGATVLIKELSTGNVTNFYGFYSITLPKGDYTVSYTYIGYESIEKQVSLASSNVRSDVEMAASSTQLEAVVVSAEAEDANVSDIEMSTAELDIKTISKIPVFAGEVDIIKSIQLLPGVSTVGEGASGFNVRGGGVGQNLILQDEAPVYQSSHLFGFFSVFNPDAVKDVKLYKGGIPAQYGGRLSSILDVRMKEGNSKEFDVSGGIGTIFSRLAVEGPIKKDKASFIVAGRRSYADLLIRPFTDVFSDGAALYFYDLTAKANYNINEKNRVYISGYFGRDVFKFDELQGFDWGNQTATIRWNHLFSDKFFSNFTTFYSNYDYAFAFGNTEEDQFDWSSRIRTWNGKAQFTYFLNAQNEISFGGDMLLYQFDPADAVGVTVGESTDIGLEKRHAAESGIYVDNSQKIGEKWSLQYGLRLSTFSNLGAGTKYFFEEGIAGESKDTLRTEKVGNRKSIASFANLEPRFSAKYQVNKTTSLKASYNRMNQYIHLVSNTVAATPIDVWHPSSNNIKPQKGDQIAFGIFKNLKGNKWETSVETYYKWTQNQVDYIDGADIFINPLLEGDLLAGKGRAYGVELYIKKPAGRLNGWLSYTLGRSELKVDGINVGLNSTDRKGRWYPTRFDQTHNLKLTSNYQLTERVNISAVFSYISGTPTSYPTDRIAVAGYVIPLNDGTRNNVRIPDYHRLDFAMTIDDIIFGKKGRKGEDNLVLSVYNVLNRQNAFATFFTQDDGRIGYTRENNLNVPVQNVQTSSFETSILGFFLPAISYNFKF